MARLGGVNSTGGTTSGANTTGATLLLAAVYTGAFVSQPTITDSKSNTWTLITSRSNGSWGKLWVFGCFNPTVGSSHTWSSSAGSQLHVDYFNGTDTSATNASASAVNSNLANSSIATGSITPPDDYSVIASYALHYMTPGSATVDSGMSIDQDTNFLTSASKVQTTAAAINPTWGAVSADGQCVIVLSVKGTPPPPTCDVITATSTVQDISTSISIRVECDVITATSTVQDIDYLIEDPPPVIPTDSPFIYDYVQTPEYYDDPNADWDAVTRIHTMEDGAETFNELNTSAPREWTLRYTGLTKAWKNAFKTHYDYFRKATAFDFEDKYGDTFEVRYKEFRTIHDGHKSWDGQWSVEIVLRKQP